MGDQKGAHSRPVTTTEHNRKKKDSFYFLARTQPKKSQGLFVYCSPPNSLFPSIKGFSFPCRAGVSKWLAMVADPKLQFSVDPKQMHLCWRNIWLSSCLRSTLCLPLQGPENTHNGSRTGEQAGVVPTLSPLLFTVFLTNPGV